MNGHAILWRRLDAPGHEAARLLPAPDGWHLVGPDGVWRRNGEACPVVAGCVDLDLNFSPSTNLLPVRRLGLAVGGAGAVRAAWLRFPFALEPLDQVYRRTGEDIYRYESGGGRFAADLRVGPAGFVTHYPGGWEAEPTG